MRGGYPKYEAAQGLNHTGMSWALLTIKPQVGIAGCRQRTSSLAELDRTATGSSLGRYCKEQNTLWLRAPLSKLLRTHRKKAMHAIKEV